MAIPKNIQTILSQLMAAPSLDLARQLDVPEKVHLEVFTEPDDATRAAEICLNFDKALRLLEQGKSARNRPQ